MEMKAILDSYWVQRGRFLAGEYPFSLDEVDGVLKLKWLLDQGVTFWLDLTEEGEAGLIPYVEALDDIAKSLGLEVVHRRFPIHDMGIPEKSAMVEILNVLDKALSSGHTVYLHCYGGIGRTGTVVGCHMVRQGIDGAAALKQISVYRENMPDGWKASPETEEQRQFVINWKG